MSVNEDAYFQKGVFTVNKTILVENLSRPISRFELISRYCRDRRVLDIGCVAHNIENTAKGNWLHEQIRNVASFCMGVDFLEKEVKALQIRGYNVVCADVNNPIDIGERFDVIVVGNLIEHLSNFDGLLMNVNRLLKPDGCVLISTANPFYSEQYFYSAFKNDILINPEHTCWIDPVALEQLLRRRGFSTQSVYWIKEKWALSEVICNGPRKSFDILTGRWISNSQPSTIEKKLTLLLKMVFRLFFPKKYNAVLDRCGSELKLEEILYIRFMSFLFSFFWHLYGFLIVKSPINNYELYMSVIKREHKDTIVKNHKTQDVANNGIADK